MKFFITFSIILLLSACQTGNNADAPPVIRYGEDACDECRMIVNEARFAAGLINSDFQTRRFDDIGCLLIYQKKHHETIQKAWVQDYQTQKWLPADNAVFIKNSEIATPMGHGIVAVSTEENARNLLKNMNKGNIYNFDILLKQNL